MTVNAMQSEALQLLEFTKVQNLLSSFTQTPLGRERAARIAPLACRSDVDEALAEVDEAVVLLSQGGGLPIGGALDLTPVLKALGAPGSFVGTDLLQQVQTTLAAAAACRQFFQKVDGAPRLSAFAAEVQPLKEVARALDKAIGPRGDLLDTASVALNDIRQETRQARQRIQQQLESMLGDHALDGVFQDRILTQRNGRYVLPLKADHRGQLDGFVHDQSASGQTLFIEPLKALPLNNRLRELEAAEKKEEEKILRRLSAQVAAVAPELRQNQRLLAHLDLRSAAARLSRRMDGCRPQVVDNREISLERARHPLLVLQADGKASNDPVVPIDLRLTEAQQVLVISGPNTGGKSVALKTLGLLVLMVRSGLHIPCDPDSRLYLFDLVVADIGDEQSIEASLSTFSGHLKRMKRILACAGKDSLVLVDEAGTGTDPAEGGALALAMLDALRRQGSRVVLTTHLSVIKGYAQLQQGVEIAAVDFNPDTLKPTYTLLYGVPGASNAFSIAQQLGVSADILDRAKTYLGQAEQQSGAIVEDLHQLKGALKAEIDDARRLRRQVQDEKEALAHERQQLEQEQQRRRAQAVEEAERLVRESQQTLKDLLQKAQISAGQSPAKEAELKGELKAMGQRLAQQKPKENETFDPAEEVALGEIVRVPAIGLEGQVVKVGARQIELDVQGKRMRMALQAVQAFSPRRFETPGPKRVGGRVERDDFQTTLKVVGQRVDEALPRVERFLDDALLRSSAQVEIVHGSGQGILRKAVRALLAEHSEVEAFYAADQKQGGENVTVVELKQG